MQLSCLDVDVQRSNSDGLIFRRHEIYLYDRADRLNDWILKICKIRPEYDWLFRRLTGYRLVDEISRGKRCHSGEYSLSTAAMVVPSVPVMVEFG